VQHVLDTALAFAVINRHFDVADFHGNNDEKMAQWLEEAERRRTQRLH
jgi:hypothetical protein